MVKVREEYHISDDGLIDIDRWVLHLAEKVRLDDVNVVKQACELSLEIEEKAVKHDLVWAKGHSSFQTGLEMAQILAELNLDQQALVASILYRAVREERLSLDTVKKRFGEDVANLIDGVQQMAAISAIHTPYKGSVLGQNQGQLDNVRKMLITMIDDVRVVLIKLAERTCAIRAVKNAQMDKRQRVAREVFDIYAPLAHRLGIGHIKWELEDLSFRYLHDTAYMKIAKQLQERRIDRDEFIRQVQEKLEQEVASSGITAEISGRSKHIYSIWRKMRRKNLDFSQIYDIRAFRILVPEIRDCYAVLGIVHSLWRHIPHEFDDYVANPKENGYRSLHTAVVGPHGKIMEIQIRTHGMHEEAELGVCAHWLYKGTDVKTKSTGYEDKINWLRQVLEWQEEIGDVSGLVEQLTTEANTDRIYVFTPEGHVVDLRQGATSVDFAYRVHTEVGHSCRGAKVNGRIVPLTYPLKTGEQVTILTSNNPAPSRDWLNPSLGYIQTSRARAKVAHWFKEQNRDQNIIDGRAILIDEFNRLSIDDIELNELAKIVNFKKASDMFAAIGAGDLRPTQVANAAQRMVEPHEEQLSLQLNVYQEEKNTDSDIQIRGVGKLMTTIAHCCQPVPGDAIIGYITIGRGVSIHRDDCSNVQQLQDKEPNRIIDVSWGKKPESTYSVDIEIQAYDREGLIRDVTIVLANERVNVTGMNTFTDRMQSTATLILKVEIDGLESLGRLLAKIKQLPNVIDAHRKRDS